MGGPLRIRAIPHRQAPRDVVERRPSSSLAAQAGRTQVPHDSRPAIAQNPGLSLAVGSEMSAFPAKVGTPMKFACRTASNLFGVEDCRFSDDARGSQLKTMHPSCPRNHARPKKLL